MKYLKTTRLIKKELKKGLNPAKFHFGSGVRAQDRLYLILKKKFGLNGAAISAVDLIKGIGITAGLDVINVEGATGNITTNFANKGKAALKALLDGKDYVYIHVEAPDECGHRGEIENKIKSIELIDRDIIGPLTEGLKNRCDGDFTILVMPDHPTPIVTKTHARDAVPFMIYRSNEPTEGVDTFDEESAKETGLYIPNGP